MTNFQHLQVYGWDNGGVELACLLCGEAVAAGGCDCCEGNEAILADLVQAARDHLCKEPENA